MLSWCWGNTILEITLCTCYLSPNGTPQSRCRRRSNCFYLCFIWCFETYNELTIYMCFFAFMTPWKCFIPRREPNEVQLFLYVWVYHFEKVYPHERKIKATRLGFLFNLFSFLTNSLLCPENFVFYLEGEWHVHGVQLFVLVNISIIIYHSRSRIRKCFSS